MMFTYIHYQQPSQTRIPNGGLLILCPARAEIRYPPSCLRCFEAFRFDNSWQDWQIEVENKSEAKRCKKGGEANESNERIWGARWPVTDSSVPSGILVKLRARTRYR